MDKDIVTERLKEARKECGLTQAEAAEKIGWERKAIISWESGIRYPPIKALKKCMEVYNKPARYFFGEDFNSENVVEELNVVDISNMDINDISQENDLSFADCVDEEIKYFCSGILKLNGSHERVSYAIAGLAGYLRVIVNIVPRMKDNTYSLVTAMLQALAKSSLETNRTTIMSLWPGLINNISILRESVSQNTFIRERADNVIKMLLHARLQDDQLEELEAVRETVLWLLDSWQYVCKEIEAYYALNNVSCLLAEAPTNYDIRNNIVVSFNSFSRLLKLFENS